MRHDALRVVAHLSSQLAGDAPHLDSLLVSVAARLRVPKDADPGAKIDRKFAAPEAGTVPIPLLREWVAGHLVARCTSPILDEPRDDSHAHIAKRIAVEYAGWLARGERKLVTTTNSWTKSYRLPLRVRLIPQVVWLCVGSRRELLSLIKEITGIGKKVAHGYGRVSRWECERIGEVPHDHWPWWIESEVGPVLMRSLPAAWDGLPRGLVGARPDYGACGDPYWHPDRYGEIVAPC